MGKKGGGVHTIAQKKSPCLTMVGRKTKAEKGGGLGAFHFMKLP